VPIYVEHNLLDAFLFFKPLILKRVEKEVYFKDAKQHSNKSKSASMTFCQKDKWALLGI
jgi:hypothetical protein